MEGGEKLTLDAEEVAEQWAEFWVKKRASISDNWVQEIVLIYYYIYYNFCKPRCINNNLD